MEREESKQVGNERGAERNTIMGVKRTTPTQIENEKRKKKRQEDRGDGMGREDGTNNGPTCSKKSLGKVKKSRYAGGECTSNLPAAPGKEEMAGRQRPILHATRQGEESSRGDGRTRVCQQ